MTLAAENIFFFDSWKHEESLASVRFTFTMNRMKLNCKNGKRNVVVFAVCAVDKNIVDSTVEKETQSLRTVNMAKGCALVFRDCQGYMD